MWGHGMGWGMGWGWWIFIGLGTLAFWILVAYLVRVIVQGRPGGGSAVTPPPPAPPTSTPSDATPQAGVDPLRLLDERLARGEIQPAEYVELRRMLTEGR